MKTSPYYLLLWSVITISLLASCTELPPKPTPFLNQTKVPSTTFHLENNQDTLLKGKEGTALLIPKNAFVDKDGQPYQGRVTLKLQEAFDLSDMILGGLATVDTANHLLASGGMFKLAYRGVKGQSLQLAEGKQLVLGLPVSKPDTSYQIFYSATDKESLRWAPVADTAINNRLLLGQALFYYNCASCHNTDLRYDMTGPALGWVTKQWPSRELLWQYTNKSGFVADTNDLAAYWDLWASSSMVHFDFSDAELEALYEYIEMASWAQGIDSTGIRPPDPSSYANYAAKRRQSYLGFQGGLSFYPKYSNFPDTLDRNEATNIKRQKLFTGKALYVIERENQRPLSWINLDRYPVIERPWEGTLSTNLESLEQVVFYKACIVWPKMNTILPLYLLSQNQQPLTLPFANGEQVYFLIIAQTEQAFYLGFKPIIIGESPEIKVTLEASDQASIERQIKAAFPN